MSSMVSSKYNSPSSSTDALPHNHIRSHSSSSSKYSRHHMTSQNDIQSTSAPPSASTNSRTKGVSFPAPSPPRSPTSEKSPTSSMSAQSLASLTPSMSPSSIISLQRSARQEKKHHIISVNNKPQKDRRNRSDRSRSSSTRGAYSEKENAQIVSTKQSRSPQNSSSTSSFSSSKPASSPNRLSKWASSIRQSFSRSHPPSSQPPVSSEKPTVSPSSHLASPPASPTSPASPNTPAAKVIEPVHSKSNSHAVVNNNKTQNPDSVKVGSSSSFSEQPRIRILNQSRKKKIGSGLIVVFCIIAIVILIFLC